MLFIFVLNSDKELKKNFLVFAFAFNQCKSTLRDKNEEAITRKKSRARVFLLCRGSKIVCDSGSGSGIPDPRGCP